MGSGSGMPHYCPDVPHAMSNLGWVQVGRDNEWLTFYCGVWAVALEREGFVFVLSI